MSLSKLSKYEDASYERVKPEFESKEVHVLVEETKGTGLRADKWELKVTLQEMMVVSSTFAGLVPKELYLDIRIYKNDYPKTGICVNAAEGIWLLELMKKGKSSKLARKDGGIELQHLKTPYGDNGYGMIVTKKGKRSALSIDSEVVEKLKQLAANGFIDRIKSICEKDGIKLKLISTE